MTREDINKSLYRPIISGKGYENLFPSSSCKPVKLATGNTEVAIKQMAKWAKKHAHQTKALAKQFEKPTLKETLNAIQWFLYHHIQYSIDGENQNLKSPACTWATRHEGTDCKSYSVFASTILLNLGIKHYLRRIKQYDYNNAFTHVYVVIPQNQTKGKLKANAQFNKDYFIIDGTIEFNNELPFKQKDDIYMEPKLPIYGLAYASLGCGGNTNCGCNSNYETPPVLPTIGIASTPQMLGAGLNAPDTQLMEQAFSNFFAFLDELEAQGLPKEAVNAVIDNIKFYIEKGVEPTIGELFGMAYMPQGLGLVPVAAPVAVGLVPKAAAFLAKFGGVISKIIPKNLFSQTFGSVFANGFNLSCWNSTFTPSKVAAEVAKIHVPFFETAVASVSNTTSTDELEKHLNYLLKAVDVTYTMYAEYMINGANWRSCSKEAINIYVDIVTGAKAQTDMMLKQLQNEYNITITTATTPAEFTFPEAYTGQPDFTWSEKQHGKATYRQVKFNTRFEDLLDDAKSAVTSTLSNVPGAVSTYVDSEGYTNYLDVNGEVLKREKQQPQKAGFGAIGVLLAAGAAYGLYEMSKKKKSK
jgi:hypothetical protein